MKSATSSSRNSCNVPHQVYSMQGGTADSQALLSRLRDLCGDGAVEIINDHMLEYEITDPNEKILGVKLTQALDHPHKPWHLLYDGKALQYRDPAVRSWNCIDARTSDNILKVLDETGFVRDREFVVKGFSFRKGTIKGTLTDMMLVQKNNPAIDLVSTPYAVELSVVADPTQETSVDEMKAFSEQLAQFVRWK